MMRLCFLAVLLVSLLPECLGALSTSEKQKSLDEHNYYRAVVALGTYHNQPAASGMPALRWHDQLAANAQTWASTCDAPTPHDSDNVRKQGTNFGNVGQNYMPCYTGTPVKDCIHTGMKAWAEEAELYTYQTGACSGDCGHYTQLVWNATLYVGCGWAKCQNHYDRFVCNYGLGGNTGNRPYKAGTTCSECPNDMATCVKGICTTAALAAASVNASAAVCEVQDDICKGNGGTPDHSTGQCRCKCGANGNVGENCEVPCEDANPQCGGLSDDLCKNPLYESYFTEACRKRCSLCLLRKRPANSALGVNLVN